MTFSIQQEGQEKQIFVTFQEARQATGIPSSHIVTVLKRATNPVYRRRSDGVRFIIKKENSPFAKIDGEPFASMDEITEKFGVSQTLFINQLIEKKHHFLDKNEISHQVEKFKELEDCLERVKKFKMYCKINREFKNSAKYKDEKGRITCSKLPLTDFPSDWPFPAPT